jgi:hypothetical protein
MCCKVNISLLGLVKFSGVHFFWIQEIGVMNIIKAEEGCFTNNKPEAGFKLF